MHIAITILLLLLKLIKYLSLTAGECVFIWALLKCPPQKITNKEMWNEETHALVPARAEMYSHKWYILRDTPRCLVTPGGKFTSVEAATRRATGRGQCSSSHPMISFAFPTFCSSFLSPRNECWIYRRRSRKGVEARSVHLTYIIDVTEFTEY